MLCSVKIIGTGKGIISQKVFQENTEHKALSKTSDIHHYEVAGAAAIAIRSGQPESLPLFA